MMSATMAYPPHPAAFPQYPSSDAAFDEWSRHIAASHAVRRPTRSSTLSGNPMRITKPGSTSSSPRSSILHPRRRTLVNDDRKRPQHVMGQYAMPIPSTGISPEPTKRSQRPMSWHPASSHFQQQAYGQPLQQQSYQQPAMTDSYYLPAQARWNDHHLIPNYQHMSPMASHSCQTSPVTFSPLSLPSNDFHSQPGFPVDSQEWSMPQQVPSYVSPPVDSCSISPAVESNLDYAESFPPLFAAANPATTMPSAGTHGSEWGSFPEHSLDGTFPPTPENLPQMQVKPAVQSEESTSYESLPEPEDDGEILVGMGLYDSPDKYAADPGLNNYRSTLSSLLGGGAPKMPESVGKGLKLEETWQPPESDDEDEDEDEENDDEEKEKKQKDSDDA